MMENHPTPEEVEAALIFARHVPGEQFPDLFEAFRVLWAYGKAREDSNPRYTADIDAGAILAIEVRRLRAELKYLQGATELKPLAAADRDKNWKNDRAQFARFIAKADDAGLFDRLPYADDLVERMGMSRELINELLTRAGDVWDGIKTINNSRQTPVP